jgi:hypothetical protein
MNRAAIEDRLPSCRDFTRGAALLGVGAWAGRALGLSGGRPEPLVSVELFTSQGSST